MSLFRGIKRLVDGLKSDAPVAANASQAPAPSSPPPKRTAPCRASRFKTHEAIVKTTQRAMAQRNPNIMQHPSISCAITVDMGVVIGEGWEKGTGEYFGTTTTAVVRFDPLTGKPFNAYPVWDDPSAKNSLGKHQDRTVADGEVQIEIILFDSAIAWLDFVVNHPEFNGDDRTTALPLLPPIFIARLERWEQEVPGAAAGFKLAYQYILNRWDEEELEIWWTRRMDFGLFEPTRSFLLFLWEAIYPGEPWQRTFPDDVIVIPT